jgi:hypothetical protein
MAHIVKEFDRRWRNNVRLVARYQGGSQSHEKLACDWQPVAFKLYPSGRQSQANSHQLFSILHATGGHSGAI